MGGFDVSLGMKGIALAYAEEVELQQRAIENLPDLEIYFDSDLWLYHHVRKEKLKISWMLKNYFLMGFKGFEGLNAIRSFRGRPDHRKWTRLLKIMLAICYRILRICVRIPILFFWRGDEYPYWQQYLIERILGIEIKKIGIYYAEIDEALSSLQGHGSYGHI
jgi:hypothetical protein